MTPPSTLELLLEIGCEEIPARFLTQAQKDFGERLESTLEEGRLLYSRLFRPAAAETLSSVITYSTPRRLIAHVPCLLAKQSDKTDEITGPSVKVAIDVQGRYTRAAESFAQKNSADVNDLLRITTLKGEYLAVKKTTFGRPALDVLSEVLPDVITGISFPKSMYWTVKSGPRFVRPIRWLLAVLGEGNSGRVVPFEIAGVRSGDSTFGLRSMGRGAVQVAGFEDYLKKLHDSQVELEPEKRRGRVRVGIKGLLEEFEFHALQSKAIPEAAGLRLIEDRELENWVVNSTEWPVPVLGQFDILYNSLPREIVITVMRYHQKYFAIENQHGVLQSRFVTVLNSVGDNTEAIRRAHERVLTARFADALFFLNADRKRSLKERLPLLERVTYQVKLGSYADKVRRMESLLATLSEIPQFGPEVGNDNLMRAAEAIKLSKCDLTTHMVQEFPELQGIIGGLYAAEQGIEGEIADAIYDQYLPVNIEDRCPRTKVGALLSFTDKFETIFTGFAVGNNPTGSSDPFGMRRLANGVIKIAVESSLPVAFRTLAPTYFNALVSGGLHFNSDFLDPLLSFLDDRLRFYLETVRGIRYDTVRAVMLAGQNVIFLAGSAVPAEALRRALALEGLRDSEDFQILAQAAKRIRNILAKSAALGEWTPGEIDVSLLKEPTESQLWVEFADVGAEAEALADGRLYEKAFKVISRLKPAVDRFFEHVLVMSDDPSLRLNRLRLLRKLDLLFCFIADLSQIESPTSFPVDASTTKEQ